MNSTNFQDVIARLVRYWQELGCVVQQPYNVQVGAGTMNPATVLRVLGPEPWNVVYVEPSIRPDDGRFGDNPNRMQMHHQLQVILKPDPGNPQEQYLKSLEAIGINPRQHDIRFVEDNWESPALGAWGLGWEVWLDGQEITQFTYFQQAGSLNLDPVCVEITYGLDRIILALQDKNAVWEMNYNDQLRYEDVLLQSEIEHCQYYFHVADVEALRNVYATYERECLRCIEAGLVVPAHDYNLKCSHLFNVLDTRGAVGVTERANFFKRMRANARQIAELYAGQREKLGYPLLQRGWKLLDSADSAPLWEEKPTVLPTSAQTFLLEIGQEELPPDDLDDALNQLRLAVPKLLEALRLDYESVTIDGTPRRLVVLVEKLAPRQADRQVEKVGPPAERAFDSAGKPTKAAEGFAKGQGVAVDQLSVIEQAGKRYVAVHLQEIGRTTPELLADALPDLIGRLKFKKTMRWNASNVAYSRPLRWFVALYGDALIPFSYAHVQSGRVSRGLRPYDSPAIVVESAEQYAQQLAEHQIFWRTEQRRALITQKSAELAQQHGGYLPDDSALIREITHLVECPTPFVGHFDPRYLQLPPEILVAVMRKHQRYLPIYLAPNQLLNAFVAVRNGDEAHLESVRHGNEQVIRARFADAEFFYGQDKGRALADFVPELETLTFQTELGSMLAKQERVTKLVPLVAEMIALSADDQAHAVRAASLCKADLATTMVVEMTSLQGVMGGHYAQLSGESAEVCTAIATQYQPITHTPVSNALALADRLDSLVGLTAAGLLPKGSNDPFALRRAAIQLIENLLANHLHLDLRQLIARAASLQPITVTPEAMQAVRDFVTGRLEGVLRERGSSASVVKAVLAEQAHDPYTALVAAQQLQTSMESADWSALLDAFARCVRITRKESETYTLNPDLLSHPAERELWLTYKIVRRNSDETINTFVQQLRQLAPTINQFFEGVLVMDDDLAVRQNRFALLQNIVSLAHGLANFAELEGF